MSAFTSRDLVSMLVRFSIVLGWLIGTSAISWKLWPFLRDIIHGDQLNILKPWSICVDNMCWINSSPINHACPKSIDQTMCWTSPIVWLFYHPIWGKWGRNNLGWPHALQAITLPCRTCRCPAFPLRTQRFLTHVNSLVPGTDPWKQCPVVWSDTKSFGNMFLSNQWILLDPFWRVCCGAMM